VADKEKFHQGQYRQAINPDEAEAQKDAGLTPGITPDLHAPEIVHPADTTETNLHGDVPGSPYSTTPGEMSVAEAAEQSQAASSAPATDDRDTRARELESRRTGVDTETLAAEDEAEQPNPPSKRSNASRKK
jgi:hypothetical protein